MDNQRTTRPTSNRCTERASEATGTAGFPNRRSILPIRPPARPLNVSPLYDAAKFQAGNAEFNGSNCISGGAVHGTLYSAGGEQQHAVVMVRGNRASPIVDVKGIGATFASHTADPD